FAWASNFYLWDFDWLGRTFPSGEHAYQWSKTSDEAERQYVLFKHYDAWTRAVATSPAEAKLRGKGVTLRPNWESIRRRVMLDLTRAKYSDPVLRGKLLATGDAILVEGNHWHDRYWGVCHCQRCGGRGENNLGRVLMRVRRELSLA